VLQEGAGQTDGQLLDRFVRGGDRLALETLVYRHAPMVWGVCRRTLTHLDQAEDAFQATFLVLVRKAASIRSRELLPNWLYRVAHKTACKARQTDAKRSAREKQVAVLPEPQPAERSNGEFSSETRALLDEELTRLPEKYRLALVLCDLQGRSLDEAARQLRLPNGTVASRLARGRARLARRLARRGATVSATALATAWSQAASGAVPAALLANTVQAVGLLAAGQTVTAGLLSARVCPLREGVLRAMTAAKRKAVGVVLLLAGLAMGGGALAYHILPNQPRSPEQPPATPGARQTGKDSKDPDPKTYGTAAGASDFARRYLREHPALPEAAWNQDAEEISRIWPSRAFEVRFDPKTHQWTVTGSCRMDTDFEGVMRNPDGILDAKLGPGKSWEWDWKLALTYNPSVRGYEVQKLEGFDTGNKRPASMDDYGKWLQGRFTKPRRSADPVTALRLVLDVPERTKFGLERDYSYGKNKIAVEPTPRGVTVSIGDPRAGGQAEQWSLLFEASIRHSLKMGEYGGAWHGRPSNRGTFNFGPLIRVDHIDRGKQTWGISYSWTGEFVIREIELQDKKVVQLAIDFITDSEYGLPARDKRDSRHILCGSLRYNSQFEPSIPGLDAAERGQEP
jgi:RNA polymerase sigma factor (sigma-70 family)